MPFRNIAQCGPARRSFVSSDSIQWSALNPQRLTFAFSASHSSSHSRYARQYSLNPIAKGFETNQISTTCSASRRGYNLKQSTPKPALDARPPSFFNPSGTALLHSIIMEDVSRASPEDWQRLRQLKEDNSALDALVISVPEGEYMCISVGKMRGVIQLDELGKHLRKLDPRKALGQTLELKILQIDEAEGVLKLCGSASHEMLSARFDAIESQNFVAGDILTGTVASMTKYGAFVNLCPGLDGFLHISNMSSKFVKSVADLFTNGDQVEVVVMYVDLQRMQVALAARFDLGADPQEGPQ